MRKRLRTADTIFELVKDVSFAMEEGNRHDIHDYSEALHDALGDVLAAAEADPAVSARYVDMEDTHRLLEAEMHEFARRYLHSGTEAPWTDVHAHTASGWLEASEEVLRRLMHLAAAAQPEQVVA